MYLALTTVLLTLVAAAPKPSLNGSETIVFFGDSITQGGGYVELVELALTTRFPQRQFRIINSGRSSETISGTSETDHDPRRPNAHDRFDRDVASFKPDRVVVCFGMNDGNYHPFDEKRFVAFQKGTQRLQERAQAIDAQLTLLTPPVYDAYRRRAIDPEATSYGYKFPAVDYDETLHHYSQWLLGVVNERTQVVDVHAAFRRELATIRQRRVSDFLSGDGIHPGPAGHWLMARELLMAWNILPRPHLAEIDVAALDDVKGTVKKVQLLAGVLSFTWELPVPVTHYDPITLRVSGLAPGRFRLMAEGAPVAILTHEELARGAEMARIEKFPAWGWSTRLLSLVKVRRKGIQDAWLSVARDGSKQDLTLSTESTAAAESKLEEQEVQIREEAMPYLIEIRLEQVDDDAIAP